MIKLSIGKKKSIKSLHSKTERISKQKFLVEGEKLCEELIKEKFEIESLVVRTDAIDHYLGIINVVASLGYEVYECDRSSFEQISDQKNPQGIMAIAKIKESKIKENTNYIIADNINDPGNLGTLIRTGDWFGFNDFILFGSCADIWNPKTLRASMGSVFRLRSTRIIEIEKVIELSKNIIVADMGGTSIFDTDYSYPFALVLGSESAGVNAGLMSLAKSIVSIPGKGNAESLNVAVSAGVIMCELSKNL